MGTVEKISIRSMQLRHHKGPIHTIPYGEIPKLTNYSRDWVIKKLWFTVPFETDPNKVKKIFMKIGQEMMQIPEFADDLLQPFKSQGVFDFDDVGMIIRGKFMAAGPPQVRAPERDLQLGQSGVRGERHPLLAPPGGPGGDPWA